MSPQWPPPWGPGSACSFCDELTRNPIHEKRVAMTHPVPESATLPGVLARGAWDGQGDADASARTEARAARVRSVVAEHYTFLWRSLRRLGVPEADVEDAAQKCLWVVAQRIDDIQPGKEKTFLFGVALRVAKAAWRQRRDRCTVSGETTARRAARGAGA